MHRTILAGVFTAVLLLSLPVYGEDLPEKAGVGVGVVAGNLIYVPVKIVTMALAFPQGALSWVLSAGNKELTEQIWQDNLEGPYFINPEIARTAIGERPLLVEEQQRPTSSPLP
jgi:hypothetical protein